MQILREHLAPGNYEWDNEMIYTGDPSRRLYNRNNGNQLLFVINSYAAPKTTFDLEQGLMIQYMLKNELPIEAKSEKTVIQWLNEKIIT